jgi:hypothetical protein
MDLLVILSRILSKRTSAMAEFQKKLRPDPAGIEAVPAISRARPCPDQPGKPTAGSARSSHSRAKTSPAGDGLGWRSPHAIVGLGSAAAIAFGWVSIDELDLSPAVSVGYALGILGLAMMVLLLAYSIRKRARALRNVGAMRNWFEVHLVLGMLVPAVILYHANFTVESANAAIALGCLLVVAGSGVGGRFLYGRLHRGLAGELRSVAGLQRQARECLIPAEAQIARNGEIPALIAAFEQRSAGLTSGFLRALPAVTLRVRAHFLRRQIANTVRSRGIPGPDLARIERAVSGCLAELCRAGELRLFTQLFALWHAVHIPLTVILFLSATIHVVAVHLY